MNLLPLKVLIDESIDSRIVKELRIGNFEIFSVSELNKGITDKEVLQLSRDLDSILLTEDRDFGEWVFAHQEKAVGVIYLRYKVEEISRIIHALLNILVKKNQSLYGKFIVITPDKIRIRDIPFAG